MYFVPFWLHNQNKVKFEYLVSLVNGTINYGTFRILVSSWNNRRNQSIFLSFFSLAFLLFFFSIFTLFTPLLPLSLLFLSSLISLISPLDGTVPTYTAQSKWRLDNYSFNFMNREPADQIYSENFHVPKIKRQPERSCVLR